jgi:hypothetical protein
MINKAYVAKNNNNNNKSNRNNLCGSKKRVCYICRKYGHLAKQCPKYVVCHNDTMSCSFISTKSSHGSSNESAVVDKLVREVKKYNNSNKNLAKKIEGLKKRLQGYASRNLKYKSMASASEKSINDVNLKTTILKEIYDNNKKLNEIIAKTVRSCINPNYKGGDQEIAKALHQKIKIDKCVETGDYEALTDPDEIQEFAQVTLDTVKRKMDTLRSNIKKGKYEISHNKTSQSKITLPTVKDSLDLHKNEVMLHRAKDRLNRLEDKLNEENEEIRRRNAIKQGKIKYRKVDKRNGKILGYLDAKHQEVKMENEIKNPKIDEMKKEVSRLVEENKIIKRDLGKPYETVQSISTQVKQTPKIQKAPFKAKPVKMTFEELLKKSK